MSEHLLKAGGTAGERPIDEGVRLPHLRAWFRTRSAIVLHLSNGILQVINKTLFMRRLDDCLEFFCFFFLLRNEICKEKCSCGQFCDMFWSHFT